MYRLEDVEETVQAFIKKEFPEIMHEVAEADLVAEIAALIFDMLTGDDGDADD